MATPAEYNISVTWGDTVPIRFMLQTRDEDSTLIPLDLTGSEILLELRMSTTVIKYHSEGDLTGDLAAGEIIWTPTAEETRRMSKNGVRYFLQRQVDGGEWRTYLTGLITGSEGPSGG